MFSNGSRAHNIRSGKQRKKHKKHQRHLAGKPKNSKRHQHAVAQHHERSRRYAQTRDQELRRQMHGILLEAQPKMVAVESLHSISMMASAKGTAANPGKNVAAKRKLNESLAEAAIGHVGKLLREEAAKLGIPTVSVPPQGTSQTCPNCGYRHPKNRESQAVFRCRQCNLYAHADWTASVIIRNRVISNLLLTGWREQPSRSSYIQPMLPGLSVFKLKGSATIRHGGRVSGPKPDPRIQSGSPRRPKCLTSVSNGTHSGDICDHLAANPFPGSVLNSSTRSRKLAGNPG